MQNPIMYFEHVNIHEDIKMNIKNALMRHFILFFCTLSLQCSLYL